MAGRDKLDVTKAPALPFAPVQYDRSYSDTTHNILRQYFNTLDNVTGQLLANAGGHYLTFPHIAAQDTTDQYATATNTATKVLWNTLDSGLGFALNPNSTATPTYTGVYKIEYTLQFFNTSSQIHDAYVWLRIDNVDIDGSGSIFSIPNSHGGVPGALAASASVTFEITGGEQVALWWATNLAATSGGANGVYLHEAPVQTTPFPMPSTPSARGAITFVSGVLA
jgi:hypothetical protein